MRRALGLGSQADKLLDSIGASIKAAMKEFPEEIEPSSLTIGDFYFDMPFSSFGLMEYRGYEIHVSEHGIAIGAFEQTIASHGNCNPAFLPKLQEIANAFKQLPGIVREYVAQQQINESGCGACEDRMYEDDDEQVIDHARARRLLKDSWSSVLNDSLEEILGRRELIHANDAYYELMSEMQERLGSMDVTDIEKFLDENIKFRKEFEKAISSIEDMIGDQETN